MHGNMVFSTHYILFCYICSKCGFCIIMPEGIIDLRLIIMLLVGMS